MKYASYGNKSIDLDTVFRFDINENYSKTNMTIYLYSTGNKEYTYWSFNEDEFATGKKIGEMLTKYFKVTPILDF